MDNFSPCFFRDQWLDAMQEAIEYIEPAICRRHKCSPYKADVYALASLLKGTATARSIVLVARSNLMEDAAILTRTLAELLIQCIWTLHHEDQRDLRILLNDLTSARSLRDLRKDLANDSKLPPDHRHSYQEEYEVLRAKTEKLEHDIRELHGRKAIPDRPISLRKKAIAVDMLPYYDITYSFLCDATHSNTNSLNQYGVIDQLGISFSTTAFQKDEGLVLSTAHQALIDLALFTQKNSTLVSFPGREEVLDRLGGRGAILNREQAFMLRGQVTPPFSPKSDQR